MDAHALLTSQGWRGTGHSLHPTDDRNGLTHHILIKRNNDGSGLGSKKDHKVEAWWMNAFDQALKGIDTKSGTMKQTLKGGALEKITARGAGKYTGSRGLYTSFVRGGTMEGTLGKSQDAFPTPPDSGITTPVATEETKEERRARREAKRIKKEAKKRTQEEAQEKAARILAKKKAKKEKKEKIKTKPDAGETKEQRRARRDARRKRKEEKRRLKAASGG
ncbi:hypothetical protein F4778DRAFT_784486 [Xylariomycetidae sp. FL2044]|nr:hypothetical protein F4778DRAFT_784486 [Xylariomycetidae sp. FL2044]